MPRSTLAMRTICPMNLEVELCWPWKPDVLSWHHLLCPCVPGTAAPLPKSFMSYSSHTTQLTLCSSLLLGVQSSTAISITNLRTPFLPPKEAHHPFLITQPLTSLCLGHY